MLQGIHGWWKWANAVIQLAANFLDNRPFHAARFWQVKGQGSEWVRRVTSQEVPRSVTPSIISGGYQLIIRLDYTVTQKYCSRPMSSFRNRKCGPRIDQIARKWSEKTFIFLPSFRRKSRAGWVVKAKMRKNCRPVEISLLTTIG